MSKPPAPKKTKSPAAPANPVAHRDNALSVHHAEHMRWCKCAPRRMVRGR